MAIAITTLFVTQQASKGMLLLKFKSSLALRLTASVSIICQLGLDLCPVSPADGADPVLVHTIVGHGSGLLP